MKNIIMGVIFAMTAATGCANATDETPADHKPGHQHCDCTDTKSKESLFYGTFCPAIDPTTKKYFISRGHFRDTVDGRDKSICFTTEHTCSCPAPKE